MRLSWAVAAAALAFSSAASAGMPNPMEDEGVTIGIGIICNTSEQMQRLVGLRAGGAEITRAVSAVNDAAKDPRACGVATVAFLSDKLVDMKNVRGKLVQIVRISVFATFDGRHWARIPVLTQYALIAPEGYAI